MCEGPGRSEECQEPLGARRRNRARVDRTDKFRAVPPSIEPPDSEHPVGYDEARRSHAAWRTWLGALGTDAEAALSAAFTYEALDEEARLAWLDALDVDLPQLSVPVVAIYAPLLAVEKDEARRKRISLAMGELPPAPPRPRRALRAICASGERVCAIVSPLYLEFVELLVCRYHPDHGVVHASYDPLQSARRFAAPCALDGETADDAGLEEVVEDLAHAVLADRREGRAAPVALVRFADLFSLTVAS